MEERIIIVEHNKKYYFKDTDETLYFTGFEQNGHSVCYKAMTKDSGEIEFRFPKSKVNLMDYISEHPIESRNNINQDIINLIESGYQFKSFWGTTLDGKEFHVDTVS